jgi:hypothetical protein
MMSVWAAVTVDTYAGFLIDFAMNTGAAIVLAYGVYLPRYRRPDLAMAYVTLNVALFLVLTGLFQQQAALAIGAAFGLFAILSIVRLRSEESSYTEIAYFFGTLALAVINGLKLHNDLFTSFLSACLIATIFTVDHPRLSRRIARRRLLLDEVYADDELLVGEIERRIGGRVLWFSVDDVDYVREITRITVQFAPSHAQASRAAGA